jgi:alpha-galactosidase
MIPIVESVSQDIPRVIIVNTLNRDDYVGGIPRDFEVEIPALVSKHGIQGIKTNGLPKAVIAHILRDRVAPVEMELAAYEQGSRALLTQLVLMDKWTQSVQHATDLIDAIFAFPYHAELREHYR